MSEIRHEHDRLATAPCACDCAQCRAGACSLQSPPTDLTDEQFVDLAVAIVHVLFDPEPPGRQRLRRVRGRLRPAEQNPAGEPLPERIDSEPER